MGISRWLGGTSIKMTALMASTVLTVGYLVYFDYMRTHNQKFRQMIGV